MIEKSHRMSKEYSKTLFYWYLSSKKKQTSVTHYSSKANRREEKIPVTLWIVPPFYLFWCYISAVAAHTESLALWFSQFIHFCKWIKNRHTLRAHRPASIIRQAHIVQHHLTSLKGIQTLRNKMFSQEPLYVLTKLHNVFGHMGCTFSCGHSLTLFNLQTTENTYTLYCACGCGES